MPYRLDAAFFVRERARMLSQLRELERQFTDVFWRDLAPSLGLSRSSQTDWASGRDELDIEQLRSKLAQLEAVIAQWSRIERRWSKAKARPPVGPGSSRVSVAEATAEAANTRETLHVLLAALGPHIPLDVRVQSVGRAARWSLVTSSPQGAGPLSIEPEGLLDDLRKLAGVLRDIDVGDDEFDGVFLVQGHELTARSVLEPTLRRSLLRLGAHTSRFRVSMSGGVATLECSDRPVAPVVSHGVAILRRLRRAPSRTLRTAA